MDAVKDSPSLPRSRHPRQHPQPKGGCRAFKYLRHERVDEHSPCLSLLLLSSAFQDFSVFRTKRLETQRKGGAEKESVKRKGLVLFGAGPGCFHKAMHT